jgi:AcrR family transcriptional regulator
MLVYEKSPGKADGQSLDDQGLDDQGLHEDEHDQDEHQTTPGGAAPMDDDLQPVTVEPMPAKRLGRPPRITPAQIAEAALAIGLDQATIRNVADRLGMSVPGLYHHVRTREELLAMAAAHGLGEVPLPEDHGQPWTEWMLEYGRFVFDALVAQPEIVGQILAGTYNTIRLAQHLEGIFTVLTTRGFTVEEADRTRRRLTDAVNGAAVAEIGRRSTVDGGHTRLGDLRRAVQALGPTTVPLLAELVSTEDDDEDTESDPFDTVRLVVAAMAAERGDR